MSIAGVAALGIAAHSGWAAAVALGLPHAGLDGSDPLVLARTTIEMFDLRAPEAKQPYHAVEGLELKDAAPRLDGYRAAAVDMAYRALHAICNQVHDRGYGVRSAGILESGGRKGQSLAAILASHALIHSADGDHFRDALADAAARYGLTVTRLRARDLETQAEARLGRPVRRLRQTIDGLGRQVGPPWGADQKTAALLAWLLVAPAAPRGTGVGTPGS